MLDANKLQQAVDQAYTQFHSLNGGQNADYIPFLANVNGSGFKNPRVDRLLLLKKE